MPKPKQGTKKAPEAPAVDWAEKLKASMNQAPAATSSALYEDDDLSALLRAQLSKSAAATAVADENTPDPLDTAEFEADDVLDTESDADDTHVDEDDMDDDTSSDFVDEYPSEDELFEDDLKPGLMQADLYEDDFDEDTLEEVVHHADALPNTDLIDADEVAYDDLDRRSDDLSYDLSDDLSYDLSGDLSDDPPDDPSDDLLDTLTEDPYADESDDASEDGYEENTLYIREGPAGLSTEEILDRAFAEEAAEKAHSYFLNEEDLETLRTAPKPASIKTAYQPPAVEVWTDDRLNGLRRTVSMGGDRLRSLAQENKQLVLESEVPSGETPFEVQAHYEDILMDSAPRPDSPSDARDRETDPHAAPAAPRIYAPLQLGLDDISPTVRLSAKLPVSASPTDGHSKDYTTRMSDQKQDLRDMNDTEMVLGLGYEDSLRRTDAQLRVERLAAEQASASRSPSCEHPTVDSDREYVGREDNNRVEEAYTRKRHKNIARLLIAGMGALVGLFYDLLPVWLASIDRTTIVDAPYYIPAGLAWMLLICIPFVPRLARGMRSLLHFEPTRYAVSACALSVAFAGGACAWVVGNPYALPLFCGSALLTLTVASLSELLVTEGEHRAFGVVSSGKPIHVLTDEITPSASALLADQSNRPDERTAGQKIFTVSRAGHVADYFARTARYNPYMGRLNYFLPVTLLIAIICAGIAIAVGGGSVTDGVRVFLTAYLACLPSAYLIAMTLPLCTVNGYLAKKGTAVIGSAAPHDYAAGAPAHLIFSDGDALRGVYRNDITLRDDPQSADYSRMADVVFRLLNTPLAQDPILLDDHLDHYRIEISERGDRYLRLYLIDTQKDTSTEIMMGSHAALIRRGVRLPKIHMEKKYKRSTHSHVLYLAFNRSFHLAYSVEYRVKRTFGRTVSALGKLGYAVDIATFDPLFDSDMDKLNRLRKRNQVEVLRPDSFEFIRKGRSSGVIATGRSLDILYPLNACRAMRTTYQRGGLSTWLCLPLAVAAVVTATCLGGISLLTSGAVAIWQLVCACVTLWITLSAAGRRVLHRDAPKDVKKADEKSASQTPDQKL